MWHPPSPYDLLWLIVAATGAGYAAELLRRRRWRRALRRLAAEWRLTYGRADTLLLAPRVARHFPVPGAARLRVTHIIYGAEGRNYRYVFTAEYTAGVVGGKRRLARAGTFTEPRDRAGPPSPITLAPADLPLVEQYRYLAPVAVTPTPGGEIRNPKSE